MSNYGKQRAGETRNIHQFIKSIIGKNYAEANKYLQGVLDEKMKSKIQNSAKKRLF